MSLKGNYRRLTAGSSLAGANISVYSQLFVLTPKIVQRDVRKESRRTKKPKKSLTQLGLGRVADLGYVIGLLLL